MSQRFQILFLILVLTPSTWGAGPSTSIGLYTGTFDPPHLGHLELLRAAKKTLNIDQLIVIVNPSPAHKLSASPFANRYEMAKIAFSESGIQVADEATEKLYVQRGFESVLQKLIDEHGQATHVFHIMGSDSFEKMVDKQSKTFSNVTIAVSCRLEDRPKGGALSKKFGASPVRWIEADEKGYSSTQLRSEIRRGVVPESIDLSVMTYVREHGLYLNEIESGLDCDWMFRKPELDR